MGRNAAGHVPTFSQLTFKPKFTHVLLNEMRVRNSKKNITQKTQGATSFITIQCCSLVITIWNKFGKIALFSGSCSQKL